MCACDFYPMTKNWYAICKLDTHYQEGFRVTFMKTCLRIAGLVFFPPNFDAKATYPAIVFTHPGGGVKEQVASLYCWNLAQKGYVTLAFDASYQGESEGTSRHLEDPTARVDDIRAAIDYLTTLPYVDNERIGAMGVCAGGGYTMSAVQTEMRIKAAVGVCAWNVGTWIRDGLPFQGKNAAMPAALNAAAAARTTEANGGEPQYVGYVPNSPAEFTDTTPTIMKEASDYYMTERCQYPTAVNKMAVQSLDRLAPSMPSSSSTQCLHAPFCSLWEVLRTPFSSARKPTTSRRSPRSSLWSRAPHTWISTTSLGTLIRQLPSLQNSLENTSRPISATPSKGRVPQHQSCVPEGSCLLCGTRFGVAMYKGVCKTTFADRAPRQACSREDGKGRYFATDQCQGESNGGKRIQRIQHIQQGRCHERGCVAHYRPAQAGP